MTDLDVKGVGTLRAIFGPVPETVLRLTIYQYMLSESKILRFKLILTVFCILGKKIQKMKKYRGFLENFNNFYSST